MTSMVILFLLTKSLETSSKEYYCTNGNTWSEAITTCTKLGGVPLSRQETITSTDFTLKDNRTVWTADFVRQEYVQDVDVATANMEEYECGYMIFNHNNWFGPFEYSPNPNGIQYDQCTKDKTFLCKSTNTGKFGIGYSMTWFSAYNVCLSSDSFILWEAEPFKFDENIKHWEIWVRQARHYSQAVVSENTTLEHTPVRCGTNNGEVNRHKGENCGESLEAICRIDTNINGSETLTRDCFKEVACCNAVMVDATGKETTAGYTTATLTITNSTSNKHITGQHGKGGPLKIVIAVTCSVCLCVFGGIVVIFICKKRLRKTEQGEETVVQYVNGHHSPGDHGPGPEGTYSEVDNTADVVTEYYESCDNYTGDIILHEAHSSTESTNRYGISSPNITHKQDPPQNEVVVCGDTDYDSTWSVRNVHDSSNIYNRLGADGVQPLYDTGHSPHTNGRPVDSSTNSSSTRQTDTYDTTAWVRGQQRSCKPTTDNIYDTTVHDGNQLTNNDYDTSLQYGNELDETYCNIR